MTGLRIVVLAAAIAASWPGVPAWGLVDSAFEAFERPRWQRTDRVDEFSDRRVVSFAMKAERAEPPPPFGRWAGLVIRCEAGSATAFLQWGDLAGLDHAYVMLRLDDGEPWTERLGSSDSGTAAGWWTHAQAMTLIGRMAGANTLRARVASPLGRTLTQTIPLAGLADAMGTTDGECPPVEPPG